MPGLITDPIAIWLAVESDDMRRGIDGLSMIAQEALGKVPFSGVVIVFSNRPGNRIKVLLWYATGVWLCQRRS
ncbi:IS66 family insertion sequence element accessory protein TnpB [Methylobacter sp. S3L5C]|uniref:IS66 family insertion sequence element accessory protein TnpB n=1 Tax=Methylobacter sp. S3L5C TaxID=2839024 RepID=UPI001FADE367|nr:IS66 family insertion sequence element accessory protein TnpB [Methylobacter sp. S3L5C]UOA09844.1 IS66 family insertion sequence element accessory protein TnpB [Methylobacter sp. S3L5C]